MFYLERPETENTNLRSHRSFWCLRSDKLDSQELSRLSLWSAACLGGAARSSVCGVAQVYWEPHPSGPNSVVFSRVPSASASGNCPAELQ